MKCSSFTGEFTLSSDAPQKTIDNKLASPESKAEPDLIKNKSQSPSQAPVVSPESTSSPPTKSSSDEVGMQSPDNTMLTQTELRLENSPERIDLQKRFAVASFLIEYDTLVLYHPSFFPSDFLMPSSGETHQRRHGTH